MKFYSAIWKLLRKFKEEVRFTVITALTFVKELNKANCYPGEVTASNALLKTKRFKLVTMIKVR